MSETSATRKAALWVGTVFLLGLALGGVCGYLFPHRNSVAAANPPLSEPERRARRVDQLTHELGLSDEQRKQMYALLLQFHSEYKAIHDQSSLQLNQQIDQERQKSREQIRAILTPEQKPKFEEFVKRLDEERKKNSPAPGSPPPSR